MSDPKSQLAVLDRDHLMKMTSGDVGLALEVLSIFRQQADSWGRLLSAREAPSAWADAAHSIKGAALGIGALRLARACDVAEQLGRHGNPSIAEAAVAVDDVRSAMAVALEAAARADHELAGSEVFSASNASNS
ncbi:MAG: Hpt domain-containing protein [Pseudomonadota bacterium]